MIYKNYKTGALLKSRAFFCFLFLVELLVEKIEVEEQWKWTFH